LQSWSRWPFPQHVVEETTARSPDETERGHYQSGKMNFKQLE
jgi:hypothetical protein